jgi:FtsZ-binding cell division protein ZapB
MFLRTTDFMNHQEILHRIENKISQLGETKRQLEAQVTRLKEENASLYKINGELLGRVEELAEKNKELENTTSFKPAVQEDFRVATKQRINDLVKEIDECLALLNK